MKDSSCQSNKERSNDRCQLRQEMWAEPNNVVSYSKSSGQPLKSCPQGSDKVIRSDLGTKQRMNCSRMKMDRDSIKKWQMI